MAFDAARQQTFAAALPAPGERSAAALGLHPRAETVLAFARPFGRLISAFHKTELFARRDFGAVTVEMRGALSITRRLTVDLAFAHCQRAALLK
jgi:hypothetical protein